MFLTEICVLDVKVTYVGEVDGFAVDACALLTIDERGLALTTDKIWYTDEALYIVDD